MMIKINRQVTCKAVTSARSSSRVPLHIVRSSKEDAPVPEGTIFYGGKAFASEEEYQKAIKDGTLLVPQATPAAAAAAEPTAKFATFGEVMGFSGAPEIINGRLAQLGFVAAIAAELNSGEGVARQFSEEPTGIILVSLLVIAGSLVPAFAKKSDALGPFQPAAEQLNGRAAMIGFAALVIIEAVKGSPLF